jgi:peptide/nickel transport system substrate-binding protein
MRPFLFVLAVIAALLTPAERRLAWAYIDSPALAPLVAGGELPPIEKRLPEPPLVSTFDGTDRTPGVHGGTLRMLMGSSKDTRQMVVYGYARLVIWTPNYVLVPDLLQSIDNVGDRIFTLHLRKGHRWSDGHPFTAEDFRYFWDDIVNNKDLSPFGPPTQLLVEGERPTFKVLNDTTVRYSWTKPNPFFLPALAATTPLYIYRPAHYLKKFHAKYADPATLEKLVKADGQQNWAALHHKLDHQYRNDNPDLPTLDPWVLKTKPPSERFVFARNPYYHRVDEAGRQLPYIDDVVLSVADGKIIPAKTGAGESDLQARYIRFDNYTFLKESEKRGEGLPLRSIPEPQRQRSGLARADARCPVPPRPVACHQSARDQSSRLLRACHRGQQHRAPPEPPVPPRIPKRVDAIRSQASQ